MVKGARYKLNIAICDDEVLFRREIYDMLKTYEINNEVHLTVSCFKSGEQLINCEKEFDLYFIDYVMKSINGIRTAKILREKGIKSPIVFLTNYKEAMQEAFVVKAYRYIIKENFKVDLYKCINDYIKEYYTYSKIKVNCEGGYIIIKTINILYIMSAHNGTELGTLDGIYKSMTSLNEWENSLDNSIFFRCHKNSIVNLSYIKKVTNTIELINGERVELSRRNRKKLIDSLLNYFDRHER
jgi:DNA-binding LytR/AlgR family response regulator